MVAAVPRRTPPKLMHGPDGQECKPGQGEGCLPELFTLLSQAHMMQILGIMIWQVKGPVRFLELQSWLGISPNTLSARLKALVEAGLVTRTAFNTIPPRVDYEATSKAHGLKRVFKALQDWAAENTLTPVTITT
jgi:DNA-binding HxlR family transcriptional regulator